MLRIYLQFRMTEWCAQTDRRDRYMDPTTVTERLDYNTSTEPGDCYNPLSSS